MKKSLVLVGLAVLCIFLVFAGILIHHRNKLLAGDLQGKFDYLRMLQDPKLNHDGSSLIGAPFSNFDLNDFEGNVYGLSSLKSFFKLIVIFKLEDCNTCLTEYILWNKLHETFPLDRLVIIGICTSRDKGAILNFIKNRKIKFPVLWDPDKRVSNEMRFRSSPLRILLDESNLIVDIEGTQTTTEHQNYVFSMIDKLIMEKERNLNKQEVR